MMVRPPDNASHALLPDSMRESYDEFRISVKKVELPGFTEPVCWISRVEIYFEVFNTSDELKINLACLCMEDHIIHWFNLVHELQENLSWEKFKQVLLLQFGGTIYDNPFEKLKLLRHTTFVDDYIEHFDVVLSQVPRLLESQYIGLFMGGLCMDIHQQVHTFHPTSCRQVMQLVHDVELKAGGAVDNRDGISLQIAGHFSILRVRQAYPFL